MKGLFRPEGQWIQPILPGNTKSKPLQVTLLSDSERPSVLWPRQACEIALSLCALPIKQQSSTVWESMSVSNFVLISSK